MHESAQTPEGCRPIVRNDDLWIDHWASPRPNGRLVFTFTERTNRKLEGPGFAGGLFLELGFDVICFKSRIDAWFAGVTPTVLAQVHEFEMGHNQAYSRRLAHGSSMGAYGAIRFAKALRIDTVLAFSPLYDIRPDWESRWNEDLTRLAPGPMMPGDAFDSSTRMVIFFDSKDPDHRHASLIADAFGSQRVHRVAVPYAGHPVGFFLADTGIRQRVIADVLLHDQLDAFVGHRFANREISPTYLMYLAMACRKRGKLRWAVGLLDKAIQLRPTMVELWRQKTLSLIAFGRLEQAWECGAEARRLDDSNPHFRAALENVRTKLKRPIEIA
jgi:hypothetical protein